MLKITYPIGKQWIGIDSYRKNSFRNRKKSEFCKQKISFRSLLCSMKYSEAFLSKIVRKYSKYSMKWDRSIPTFSERREILNGEFCPTTTKHNKTSRFFSWNHRTYINWQVVTRNLTSRNALITSQVCYILFQNSNCWLNVFWNKKK